MERKELKDTYSYDVRYYNADDADMDLVAFVVERRDFFLAFAFFVIAVLFVWKM